MRFLRSVTGYTRLDKGRLYQDGSHDMQELQNGRTTVPGRFTRHARVTRCKDECTRTVHTTCKSCKMQGRLYQDGSHDMQELQDARTTVPGRFTRRATVARNKRNTDNFHSHYVLNYILLFFFKLGICVYAVAWEMVGLNINNFLYSVEFKKQNLKKIEKIITI